jgi:hypothetical protein
MYSLLSGTLEHDKRVYYSSSVYKSDIADDISRVLTPMLRKLRGKSRGMELRHAGFGVRQPKSRVRVHNLIVTIIQLFPFQPQTDICNREERACLIVLKIEGWKKCHRRNCRDTQRRMVKGIFRYHFGTIKSTINFTSWSYVVQLVSLDLPDI